MPLLSTIGTFSLNVFVKAVRAMIDSYAVLGGPAAGSFSLNTTTVFGSNITDGVWAYDLHIICGQFGRISYSSNSATSGTWNTTIVGSSDHLAMAVAPGGPVAVIDSGSRMYTSTNGKDYTQTSANPGGSLTSIAAGRLGTQTATSTFMTVGNSGFARYTMDNGASWTSMTTISGAIDLYKVAWGIDANGRGVFGAVGTGSSFYWTSTSDAGSISSSTWNTASLSINNSWNALAFGNPNGIPTWVVGGGSVNSGGLRYSTNETNLGFNPCSFNTADTVTETPFTVLEIVWDPYSQYFYMVADEGKYYRSDTGQYWEQLGRIPRDSNNNVISPQMMLISPYRKFIGGSRNNSATLYSSTGQPVGRSFRPISMPSTTKYNDIATDGTTWIAVGDTGVIARSTDGVTYNTVSVSTTNHLLSVAGLGSNWCIGMANGNVLYSTDTGQSWTEYALGASAVVSMCVGRDVAGGVRFFCAGDGGLCYFTAGNTNFSFTNWSSAGVGVGKCVAYNPVQQRFYSGGTGVGAGNRLSWFQISQSGFTVGGSVGMYDPGTTVGSIAFSNEGMGVFASSAFTIMYWGNGSDPSVWQSIPRPLINGLSGINRRMKMKWQNGYFTMCGPSPGIYISPSGYTWRKISKPGDDNSPMTAAVTGADGRMTAVGGYGVGVCYTAEPYTLALGESASVFWAVSSTGGTATASSITSNGGTSQTLVGTNSTVRIGSTSGSTGWLNKINVRFNVPDVTASIGTAATMQTRGREGANGDTDRSGNTSYFTAGLTSILPGWSGTSQSLTWQTVINSWTGGQSNNTFPMYRDDASGRIYYGRVYRNVNNWTISCTLDTFVSASGYAFSYNIFNGSGFQQAGEIINFRPGNSTVNPSAIDGFPAQDGYVQPVVLTANPGAVTSFLNIRTIPPETIIIPNIASNNNQTFSNFTLRRPLGLPNTVNDLVSVGSVYNSGASGNPIPQNATWVGDAWISTGPSNTSNRTAVFNQQNFGSTTTFTNVQSGAGTTGWTKIIQCGTVLLAGASSGYVGRSTDRGATWSWQRLGTQFGNCWGLIHDGKSLFAIFDTPGVWINDKPDGSGTWTQSTLPSGVTSAIGGVYLQEGNSEAYQGGVIVLAVRRSDSGSRFIYLTPTASSWVNGSTYNYNTAQQTGVDNGSQNLGFAVNDNNQMIVTGWDNVGTGSGNSSVFTASAIAVSPSSGGWTWSNGQTLNLDTTLGGSSCTWIGDRWLYPGMQGSGGGMQQNRVYVSDPATIGNNWVNLGVLGTNNAGTSWYHANGIAYNPGAKLF